MTQGDAGTLAGRRDRPPSRDLAAARPPVVACVSLVGTEETGTFYSTRSTGNGALDLNLDRVHVDVVDGHSIPSSPW